MFTEVSFLDRFAAARGNGFGAVEFLFPYAYEAEQIVQRLGRYDLELVLHNFPAGNWSAGDRGMACDPRRRSEFQDNVALALEYALELGVKQLHCLSGILPAQVTPERAHAAYVDNLRFAAAALHAHGIKLLIEPINTFDIPGYFLSSSAQAANVIAEVGAENIFMQYDIYHMHLMEGDLVTTIAQQLPLIAHMQVADAPGRHEPGTGEIDYRSLFALIDQLGYTGWIGCEYHPRADTVAGLGWRAAML